MPAVLALPAFWGAVAAGAAGTGAVVAAKIGSSGNQAAANTSANAATTAATAQTDAANHSADVQAKAAADTLDFTKQQAENTYQNSAVDRAANYGQWAAGQNRLGTVGAMLGLPDRQIPAFVPGVDPNFTGATSSGAASGGTTAAAGATTSTGGASDPVTYAQTLLGQGMDPQKVADTVNSKFNLQTGAQAVYYGPQAHGGVATIGLPNAYLAQNQPNGGWGVTQRASGASATPSVLTTQMPTVGAAAGGGNPIQTPISPGLVMPTATYRPGQVGAYL